MADYSDALRVIERRPPRIIWVCGDQPALGEDVLDRYRRAVDPRVENALTLFTSEAGADVWTEMSQHAVDPRHKRLVTVREAERLHSARDMDRLLAWITGANLAQVYVAAMSSRPWPGRRVDGGKWELSYPEVRDKLSKSSLGLLVECSFPASLGDMTDPRDEDGLPYTKAEQKAARIIGEWSEHIIGPDTALGLARRAGCDMARARDVVVAVRALGVERAGRGLVAGLSSPAPAEGFADALAGLDKVGACAAAIELRRSGQRQIIGALTRLEHNLFSAEAIHRAMRPVLERSDRDRADQLIGQVAKAAKVDQMTARRLWRSAKHYDSGSVRRRTDALVRARAAHREMGALETLVVEW